MGPVIPQCHLKHYDLKDQIYQFESVFLCLTLFSHIRLQHSVWQLSSRLLNDLAYFLKLFLCFCCFVLRVFVLSANEKQIERCQMMRHCDRECIVVATTKSIHTAEEICRSFSVHCMPTICVHSSDNLPVSVCWRQRTDFETAYFTR